MITKTVDGLNVTESEFEGALKFTVQNEGGKYLDKDGNLSDAKVELTLKDGGFVKGDDGKYTKTFEGVAPGKYTVTETNSDVDGYKLVEEQSATSGEGAVAAGRLQAGRGAVRDLRRGGRRGRRHRHRRAQGRLRADFRQGLQDRRYWCEGARGCSHPDYRLRGRHCCRVGLHQQGA